MMVSVSGVCCGQSIEVFNLKDSHFQNVVSQSLGPDESAGEPWVLAVGDGTRTTFISVHRNSAR